MRAELVVALWLAGALLLAIAGIDLFNEAGPSDAAPVPTTSSVPSVPVEPAGLPQIEGPTKPIFTVHAAQASPRGSIPVGSSFVLKGIVADSAGFKAVLSDGNRNTAYQTVAAGSSAFGVTVKEVGADYIIYQADGAEPSKLELRGAGEK